MGWNDVLGNLRRATNASDEEKRAFCEKLKNDEINLPRYEDDYVDGTKAAAQAFLDDEPLEYRGPSEVVDEMKAKEPA